MKALSRTFFRHFSAFSPFQRVTTAVDRLVTSSSSFRVIQCAFSTQDHLIVPKTKTRKSSPSKKKDDTTTIPSSEETSYDVITTKTNAKSRKIPKNLLSNKLITALETYKNKYGNLLVPARFSIPTNDTTASVVSDTNITISTTTTTTIVNKISKKKRKDSSDASPWPTGIHDHSSLAHESPHLSTTFPSTILPITCIPTSTLIHPYTFMT